MESPNRNVIVNEDDNRKLEIYTQGDLDASPSGVGTFASDANGTLRILKQDNKGNLNVNIQDSSGTMGVYLSGTAGTLGVRVGQVDGTVAVYFSQSAPTVKVKNETNGTIAVKFDSEPTVIASGKDGATTRPLRSNSDGAIKVYDLTAGTVSISGYSGTIGVYVDTIRQTAGVRVGQVDGTVAVYFSQSNPKVNLGTDIVNIGATGVVASNGNSVSGSTSGVSTSGVQLVAPIASRTTKVYAFSIMSTAAVNLTAKFTNGSGASPVELWRVAMISPTGGVAGANLAVTPPGYLFATPSGATLCIVLDSASLIHYSVSYFRETA